MLIFFLDLDETVIVRTDPQVLPDGSLYCAATDAVHSSQRLSNETYKAKLGPDVNVKILNPAKLTNMLEYAANLGAEFGILTSGAWDPSIRNLVADNLPLSENAKIKLRSAVVHNAFTDKIWFDNDLNKTVNADKGVRLTYIRQHNPGKYAKSWIVVLDDNPIHIEALKKLEKVIPVEATTDTPNTLFYDLAENALLRAWYQIKAEQSQDIKQVHRQSKKRPISQVKSEFFEPKTKRRLIIKNENHIANMSQLANDFSYLAQ